MQYALARLWRRLPLQPRRRLAWLLQPKFTVGVCAVLLDERDDILLLRHRFRESQGWELPGGYIGRDEQLEEALRRELREETGFDVKILSLVSAEIGKLLHMDICLLARVVGGLLDIDEREVLEARFFSFEDAGQVLAPEHLRSVRLALDKAEARL